MDSAFAKLTATKKPAPAGCWTRVRAPNPPSLAETVAPNLSDQVQSLPWAPPTALWSSRGPETGSMQSLASGNPLEASPLLLWLLYPRADREKELRTVPRDTSSALESPRKLRRRARSKTFLGLADHPPCAAPLGGRHYGKIGSLLALSP